MAKFSVPIERVLRLLEESDYCRAAFLRELAPTGELTFDTEQLAAVTEFDETRLRAWAELRGLDLTGEMQALWDAEDVLCGQRRTEKKAAAARLWEELAPIKQKHNEEELAREQQHATLLRQLYLNFAAELRVKLAEQDREVSS